MNNVSHAWVHPIVDEDTTTDEGYNENVPARVRMKEIQGMAGTVGGLSLRLLQFVFAAAALLFMAFTTDDFPSVTAFRCLVAAAFLQSLWSLSLAITDAYAILVMRSLQNFGFVSLFTIGVVTSTLTFSAAFASAGIIVLIDTQCRRLFTEPLSSQ